MGHFVGQPSGPAGRSLVSGPGRARVCKGSLVEDTFVEGSTTIGSHQWNDCLIIVMAMDQRGDRARLTLSPILMDFGPTPSVTTNPCAVLSALNKGAVPNNNLYYYDNYPHGAVVLLRYLLPHREIEEIRALSDRLRPSSFRPRAVRDRAGRGKHMPAFA